MLGIIGHCKDGEAVAHQWSNTYPKYDPTQTAKKLQHALTSAESRTCKWISSNGGQEFCTPCKYRKVGLKTPLELGYVQLDLPLKTAELPVEPLRDKTPDEMDQLMDQARFSHNGASPEDDTPSDVETLPGPEPRDAFACPELPRAARVDEDRAVSASPWLQDYIAFSRTWAPRAYEGFHEAAGLFDLSTTAARRIKIELGPRGVYPSLYLSFAARTSIYTKTTAVDIATELLQEAGLGFLLADDDATPQAFLRSLTLHGPDNYLALPPEEQAALKQQLAFAGQRGWFYEEWGQQLSAMMQKEGIMASFRSILRRLDDHKPQYTYRTIGRGRETLYKPYLTLLANVTPADLKPFVRASSTLWRDGFIARMAFIAPGETQPSTAAFPTGKPIFPAGLVSALQHWHQRLGLPAVDVTPEMDGRTNKPNGKVLVTVTRPLPETVYQLSDAVRTAFYAYDEALRTLIGQMHNEDFDGSYARFPMKALRIAGLLASLHDTHKTRTIGLEAWHCGQAIAERWRRDLHRLAKHVHGDETPSRESIRENRIVQLLRSKGPLTVPVLHSYTKWAYTDILATCEALEAAHILTKDETGRALKYALNGAHAEESATDT